MAENQAKAVKMQSIAITRQIKPILSTTEALGLAQQNIPTQFTGSNKYNPKIVDDFRSFMQHRPFEDLDNMLQNNLHIESFNPMLDDLKAYIHADNIDLISKKDLIAAKFLQEIAQHQESNNLSLSWAMLIHLRYAAAVANLANDETEFLQRSVNSHIFNGLIDNAAFNEHSTTIASILCQDMTNAYTSGRTINLTELSYTDDLLIEQTLHKSLPTRLYYPIMGFGKLGLTFMLNCYLDNVFLCGLPHKTTYAHGINFSPLTFAIHDMLHADIDPRHGVLIDNIALETKKFIRKGGSATDFINYYTPLAVARYTTLMRAFKAIINSFLTNLLPKYHMQEYKKALAGLFLILHEYPVWNEKMFRNNDLEQILQTMLKDAIQRQEEDPLEHYANALKTSALTGASALTNEEIAQYTVEQELIYDPELQLYPDTITTAEKIQIATNFIAKTTINASKNFIDVVFTMKNAQIFGYPFPTLAYKLASMDDSISMQKMCRSNITKSVLAGLTQKESQSVLAGLTQEESQSVVLNTMQEVRTKNNEIMQDFVNKALFFIKLKTSPQENLEMQYFTWQFKLENKINADSKKMLAPQQVHKELLFTTNRHLPSKPNPAAENTNHSSTAGLAHKV